MAKKTPSKNVVATGTSEELTHSPFAALSGASAPPAAVSGVAESPPPPAAAGAERKSRGRLVLRRETKHRGGKAVIVVTGFDAAKVDDRALEILAKNLKRTLGCGGTLERTERDRELVLQGDRPARVAELLIAEGFRVAGVVS
jgi:translation initiation factor 1 (eIF-1/SUI1)